MIGFEPRFPFKRVQSGLIFASNSQHARVLSLAWGNGSACPSAFPQRPQSARACWTFAFLAVVLLFAIGANAHETAGEGAPNRSDRGTGNGVRGEGPRATLMAEASFLMPAYIATRADYEAACVDLAPLDSSIADLALSPEAAVIPSNDPTQLVAFAPEVRRGLLGIGVPFDFAPLVAGTTSECVIRDHGFVPYERTTGAIHPRLEAIKTKLGSLGRVLNPRYLSVSHYRGDLEGEPIDYILLAAGDLGLLALHVGPEASPYLSDPLQLAGVVWVPQGVVAVRHIPRSHLATLVDGSGRVLIVDLTRLDERFDELGSVTAGLFPTAAAALHDPNAPAGQPGVDDARILWKSEPGFVRNTMPPIVDPRTGLLVTGDVMEKAIRIAAAIDPRVRTLINAGSSMKEVSGPVPLGYAPPEGLIDASDPSASAAAFRLEVTLPSGAAKALDAVGRALQLAVESEWSAGFDVAQSPAGDPRSHLRAHRRDGSADERPASFVLHRDLPPELEDEVWHQEGAATYVSDWIVAIGDRRASEKFKWPAGANKEAAGCNACERPADLKNRTEAHGVYELWTPGRFITVRPDGAVMANVLSGTPYAYLGEHGRLATRLTTTRARKVRPTEVLVAAHNAPVAEGMLQETHYLLITLDRFAWVELTGGDAATLEIAVTATVRSQAWGETPVMRAPSYAVMLFGVQSSPETPLALRESLATLRAELFDKIAPGSTSRPAVMYEVPDLYLAASSESKTRLLTGFKAAPFVEPASGLVYLRARWYDPSTGSWLTDDENGYAAGSSNLYAAFLNDPINMSDPRGEVAMLDNAIAGVISVAIGYGATCLFDECDNYTWKDAGVDFGLGFATEGLSSIAKVRYLRNASRLTRVGARVGTEATLDVGGEALRNELKGEDYTAGDLAFGALVNAGIGEGGAYLGRKASPYVKRGWGRFADAYNNSIFSSEVGAVGRVRNRPRNATRLRETSGVAVGGRDLPSNPAAVLRGTQGSIGVIPREVTDHLSGRRFASFREFREAFWMEIANSPYAAEFQKINSRNLARMRAGWAPLVDASQMFEGQFRYVLHHRRPISQGGGVYDLSNLIIVTPRYHEEILNKVFHGGR